MLRIQRKRKTEMGEIQSTNSLTLGDTLRFLWGDNNWGELIWCLWVGQKIACEVLGNVTVGIKS